MSVFVFGRNYIYLHLVADLEVRIVAELSSGNDTIALEADRDNYFTFVDCFYDAFHNFALLHSIKGVVILGGKFFLCLTYFGYVTILIGLPVEVLEINVFCHCGKLCAWTRAFHHWCVTRLSMRLKS